MWVPRASDVSSEPSSFAAVLLAARTAAKLSQEALAERSGMSVRAISDLERGRVARPRRRSVELLGAALGLTGAGLQGFLRAAGVAGDEAGESGEGGVPGSLCTLPPPATVFVGREAELATVRRITDATAGAATGPAVVVFSGQPGVGKTALALAAGYELADRFPDGQLFVALRGVDAGPVPPAEALAKLITALGGGTTALPKTLDDRIAAYHALLHQRRVLLVLDNAVDEAQVRPLLPVGDSLALVTSRNRLAGLPASERLFLDVLDDADAAGVLARIVGPDRCAAEPDAARRLAADCGHLPLALRIAANRLASRPDWSLRRLVDRLGDEHRRLDELKAGDLTVRGPFEISYRQLHPQAAALFRRLALVTGPDFDGAVAAPLVGVDADRAERTLDELVETSLVEPAGLDRYRLHDLVRLFALRKLDEVDPPAERAAAERRLVEFVLVTAIRAGAFFELDEFIVARLRRWRGGRPVRTRAEAARWLAVESAHWLDALHRAVAAGRYRLAVDVGEAMHWYSDIHFLPDVWPRVYELTTEAARAGGLRAEEATQRNYLGWARQTCEGRGQAAMDEHEAALAIAREVGDPREQAWSLMYIGSLRGEGQGRTAVDECRSAVDLMEAVGDPLGTAQARFYLGAALHANGEYALAEEQLRQAESYARSRLRDDGVDGSVASSVAYIMLWRARNLVPLGAPREAVRVAEEAAARFRTLRNFRGVARTLLWAAEADVRCGDLASALRRLDAAAGLFAQLAATQQEAESLLAAAELYDRIGDRGRADATRVKALGLAERIEGQPGRQLRARVLAQQAPTAR